MADRVEHRDVDLFAVLSALAAADANSDYGRGFAVGVAAGRKLAADAIRHAGRGWDRETEYGQTVHRLALIAEGSRPITEGDN